MLETSSLYERRRAAGMGPWADLYGGQEHNFEVTKYHDGWFIDGLHHGQEVKNAIDVFHGVLTRIVRPDHPRILGAMREAEGVGASHIGKTHNHKFVVECMETLADSYTQAVGKPGRALLAISGSAANNMAFRLANGYARDGNLAFLRRAYHGADVFGIGTNDAPGWRGETSPRFPNPGAPDHISVYVDYHGSDEIESDVNAMKLLIESRKVVGEKWIGYAEDVQGVGGSFRKPDHEFLTQFFEEMDIGVNDNVQTGMRRGTYLSVPRWRIRPSQKPLLVTLAKAMANGEPLGAVLAPEEVAKDMEANPKKYGLHWDTFTDNVRSARVATAVHDIFHDEKLGERTPDVREAFVAPITPLLEERPDAVTDIRGDGLMIGIGLRTAEQVAFMINNCPAYGVIVGKGSDAIRCAPLADTPLDIATDAGLRVARLLRCLPKAA